MGIAEVLDTALPAPLVPPGDDAALAGAWLARLAQPHGSDMLTERAGSHALPRTLGAYVDFLSADLELALRDRTAG